MFEILNDTVISMPLFQLAAILSIIFGIITAIAFFAEEEPLQGIAAGAGIAIGGTAIAYLLVSLFLVIGALILIIIGVAIALTM